MSLSIIDKKLEISEKWKNWLKISTIIHVYFLKNGLKIYNYFKLFKLFSKIDPKFLLILNSKIDSKFSSFLSMVDELNINEASISIVRVKTFW